MVILDIVTAVLQCCFLFLLGLWCWIKWKHRHLIQEASKLQPLFPTIPILGNLHYAVYGIEKLTGWAFEAGLRLTNQGIHTTCIWIGPYPIICVCGVEDIQKINSTLKVPERGFEVTEMRAILGNGLLTAPASVWKTTRRAIEPLFHPRNLRHLIKTFNKNSRELLGRISQFEGQRPFDVSPFLIDTSLQSICHLVFGPEIEFDVNSVEFRDLGDLLKTVPEIGLKKVFKFWLRPDFMFNFLCKKDIEKINSQWESFSNAPLKMARNNNERQDSEKKNLAENNYDNQYETIKEGPLNLVSVYDQLQQNFPEFSEKDLKCEIITMYLTGSDTVSYAVSYCLLLVAYHQDIQERLYEEISSVVDIDRDVTTEDIQRMTYLDQVFKETLRWSLLVRVVSRKHYEDIKLSDCTIPKNCGVVVTNLGPFLDHKIYPEPTKFNPDHFSPENVKKRDKSAFIPFNAGPRQCIGKLYTELLAKIILLHMMRKYKLSTTMDVYNLKRKMAVFVYNSEGYNISLESRTQ